MRCQAQPQPGNEKATVVSLPLTHLGGAARAARAIEGRNVLAAAGALVGRAEELDVAVVAPVRRPRVADEPVAAAVALLAVANHDNVVVNVRVGLVAAVEEARLVVLPVDGLGGGEYKGR